MKLIFCSLFLSGLMAAATLSAKVVTRSVPYEHDGLKLIGYLAYDDARVSASRPAPGVLIVPEWWGLNAYAKQRAEQIAGLGYVALAIDMYGDGKVTEEAKVASGLAGPFYGQPLMATRARAGLDQLLASGLVDAKRVAAIGYCFGGSTVQALAYSGAPLAGVVSFHGGLIPVPADAAAKTKAKILVCHGAVDPFIKPEELAAFTQAMDAGKFDYQLISYAGAVHAFTNADADRLAAANGLTGSVGYHEAAARRSWEHMRVFFDEIFRAAP